MSASRRSRRGAGSERRRAAEEGVLKGAHVFVEQRGGQPGAVAEAAEDGALAHSGLCRDPVDRRCSEAFPAQ